MNAVWLVFWGEYVSGVHKTLRSALKEFDAYPASNIRLCKYFFKNGDSKVKARKKTLTKEEQKLMKKFRKK